MNYAVALPQRLSLSSLHFAALMLLGAALSVNAQPVGVPQTTSTRGDYADTAASGQGLGMHVGYFDDYRNVSLVYDTPTWWSHRFENGSRLDLNAELGVTYWDARHGQPDSLWQLSATPMLRWWPNDVFYTEIGVGATVLSRTSFADRNFGSAFQFGNHIGVGVLIAQSHQVGLRFSHFSNARIKEPNDGLDVVQLTYSYRY